MSYLDVEARALAGRPDQPLLVVLPSLGTAVETLWEEVAAALGQEVQVVGVDLPGHGQSGPAGAPFSMAELAEAVLAAVDPYARGRRFFCAGVSIGGALTLQLAKDHAVRVAGAVILNSAAKIGTSEAWEARAKDVRAGGTGILRAGSEARWFAPGFTDTQRAQADRLLADLEAADAASYAELCAVLAEFDLRDVLSAVDVPSLVIGGRDDLATPPADQETIARLIPGARAVILDDVAHLAPVEAPEAVTRLMRGFLSAQIALSSDGLL